MDLKFTFAPQGDPGHNHQASADAAATPGKPLPFSTSTGSTSSELIIKVTREADGVRAVALSPDGVSYADQHRPLGGVQSAARAVPNTEVSAATEIRSVISRAVAELGDKLVTAVTALEVPAAQAAELVAAGLVTSAGELTEAAQLRTGLSAGTAVRFV